MDICPYIPEKYDDDLRLWLYQRELAESMITDMPSNSYIVIFGNEKIAVAGLDVAEKFGVLVCMTTNPNQPFNDRSRAIDLLTKKIIERSKELKLKKLFAWTKHRGIFYRSLKHGFKEMGQTMIGMELGE